MTNEEISLQLYAMIPEDQRKMVFGQERCDIEPSFMGFLTVYKYLSEIIPKHFTVVDFGCGYNSQSYLFQHHKRFIAIDSDSNKVFQAPGTEFYPCSIQDFLSTDIFGRLDRDETFAICSYVPDSKAKIDVRFFFKNLFVFYPSNKELIHTLTRIPNGRLR